MPRPQFSIRTLLWLTLVVAVLLRIGPPALSEYRWRRDYRKWIESRNIGRPGSNVLTREDLLEDLTESPPPR